MGLSPNLKLWAQAAEPLPPFGLGRPAYLGPAARGNRGEVRGQGASRSAALSPAHMPKEVSLQPGSRVGASSLPTGAALENETSRRGSNDVGVVASGDALDGNIEGQKDLGSMTGQWQRRAVVVGAEAAA